MMPGSGLISARPSQHNLTVGLPSCRFYPLRDSDTIGYFTVLASPCPAANLSAAAAANSPSTLLAATLAVETAREAAMAARLDAVQPLLQALLAEPPASLDIAGLNATVPLLWLGTRQRLCYTIPPSANVNPKGLVLYIGAAPSGTYYVGGLGASGSVLPQAAQGCINISVSSGVAVGIYTIALEDSTTKRTFTSLTFDTGKGLASFSAATFATTYVTLTVTWSIDTAHASPRDIVRIVDSLGGTAYWFYTSCKCQTAPGVTAALTGSLVYRLYKAGSVKGGYTPQLYPGGGPKAARSGANWIPWAKVGW
jgi:hypothetical protein